MRLLNKGRYLPSWPERTDATGERPWLEQQYGAEQEWISDLLRDVLTQYASILRAEALAFRAVNSTPLRLMSGQAIVNGSNVAF